jgi:hypothetical protein
MDVGRTISGSKNTISERVPDAVVVDGVASISEFNERRKEKGLSDARSEKRSKQAVEALGSMRAADSHPATLATPAGGVV